MIITLEIEIHYLSGPMKYMPMSESLPSLEVKMQKKPSCLSTANASKNSNSGNDIMSSNGRVLASQSSSSANIDHAH